MKVAIVGSGVSGLVCAHLLHDRHEVTLFEADNRIGGHVNTVRCESSRGAVDVDTGFIVCNDRTYPNFMGLLQQLGVRTQPTEMSFSVRCDEPELEYNGSNLNGLFAQRTNLLRPSFLRMLADILRFHKHGPAAFARMADETTVGEFLREHRYSAAFAHHYLLPMGAAIWSCPLQTFAQFPMRFILDFYRNHGLMQLRDRPTWHVIPGGSRTYVDRLIAPLDSCIRRKCPVYRIDRDSESVWLVHAGGRERFDEVVLACHSDQALQMLSAPTAAEREVLADFPYGDNTAVLHTDVSLLPRRRRAWAAWNYHVRGDTAARPSVTYNMNILQGLSTPETWCVTLNEDDSIDPGQIRARFHYSHPIFTTRRAAAQKRHSELIRANRTSYCGAYWGNGFHEDGVVSALSVCAAFGQVPTWSRIRREGSFQEHPEPSRGALVHAG